MIRALIGSALGAVLIALPAMGGDDDVELSGKGEFRATYLQLDDPRSHYK